MRKKWIAMLLTFSCMCSVPVWASTDVENNSEVYSYPSEDAPEEIWYSELGYSMEYDPKIFTLDDTTEADSFTYNTSEKLKAPVYISVMSYPDMDAQTLAEGIALQSDIDASEIQDTYFGADSLETKSVYVEKDYENEENETSRTIQVFYAIPKEEGSLLVEIMGYVGMPEAAEIAFERMPGSFHLTNTETEA